MTFKQMKSSEVSVRHLLSRYRDAESHRDAEGMTYICGHLIILHACRSNLRVARKYIKVFDGFKNVSVGSVVVQDGTSLPVWATSKLIQSLSLEMEDAVFLLSELGRDLMGKGRVAEAIRCYETCLLLSEARFGVRSAEELDVAEELAMIYLRQGRYRKGLRVLEKCASRDVSRSKVLEFCSGLCGPIPRVLKSFVARSPRDVQVLDIWSAVRD
jgi:tetratricopeptide (TPR) repeat protein